MEHTRNKIFSKPNDYKICKKCNSINRYENNDCWNCYKSKFSAIGGIKVKNWIYSEDELIENEDINDEFRITNETLYNI